VPERKAVERAGVSATNRVQHRPPCYQESVLARPQITNVREPVKRVPEHHSSPRQRTRCDALPRRKSRSGVKSTHFTNPQYKGFIKIVNTKCGIFTESDHKPLGLRKKLKKHRIGDSINGHRRASARPFIIAGRDREQPVFGSVFRTTGLRSRGSSFDGIGAPSYVFPPSNFLS